MTPLSTDDFPYTIGYVSELLSLEEPQLLTLVQTLGFTPKTEEGSGRTLFTHQELELLKKAAELQRHGDNLETIGKHLGPANSDESPKINRSPIPGASLLTTPPQVSNQEGSSASQNRPMGGNGSPHRDVGRSASREDVKNLNQPGNRRAEFLGSNPTGSNPGSVSSTYGSRSLTSSASSSSTSAADSITVMVEAVSQVKESILKDLAHLLDDKLAGLDEVVVELIRCKSENDSLKKRLNDAVRARESLEQELGRFKPVQFGFYRKL